MLLDTSAWVEFFNGSDKGKIVEETLKNEMCYTSIVSIAEIVSWSLKEGRNTTHLLELITKFSTIMNLNKNLAALAGELNFERKKTNKKWGMMDSFVLATSRSYNLTILTKDHDFHDLSSAKLL